MKKYLILFFVFCTHIIGFTQNEIANCCGTCTGSANCTACKNCSGCTHCKKNGGTCGACSGVVQNKVIKTPTQQTYTVPRVRVPTKEEREIYENNKSRTNTNLNYGVEIAPFTGKVRKVAKTSIANGKIYNFESVTKFLEWLPTDGYMRRLGINDNSLRTKDENYNIEIKETSILKIQLEADNDIHITICDWEDEYTPINILTVEVSGLPNELSASYRSLLAARQQFYNEFSFFKTKKSASYKTKSKSPKVTLTGSLFFDYYHNRDNEDDENNKLNHKSNTSFEIHPITWIERVD